MDCDKFEAEINDLLDARQPLLLNESAWEHQLHCDSCGSLFKFYGQMAKLTSEHSSHSHSAEPVADAWASSPNDPRLTHLVSQCLQDNRDFGPDLEEPVLAPLAFLAANSNQVVASNSKRSKLRDRFGARSMLVAALTLGFCLVIGVFFQRIVMDPQNHSSGPQDGMASVGVPERGTNDNPTGTTGNDTALAAANLQQLAGNWDESAVNESVVAFDRGWQQIAVGRVRAHQLPGMQPAVYPITGAVEAFRKNMIVRNPNGLAAGLRW